MSSLDRRDFLRVGLAGSLLVANGLPVLGSPASSPKAKTEPGSAKNVIFLVSDGMSLGTLVMAERHLHRQEGRGSNWFSLYGRPDARCALMDTCSASSLVTDSAAASSAWGSGRKINNGNINIDPGGRPCTPVMHLALEAGKACGLVSTATITHATPAGFAAQVSLRAEESSIADQYLGLGIDVLLGGGSRFFEAGRRKDKRDLLADFTAKGYQVVRHKDALGTLSPTGKLLGLFDDSHLPYSLDHRADPQLSARVPTLAEMARTALSRLSGHAKGFLLQIEGARVDHAAHANDIGGLLYDQLAFDQAVGVVLEFAAGRDDTLVIITSDHGNANPGLNGTGGNFDSVRGSYYESDQCFDRIAKFRQTNVWALAQLKPESSSAEVRERVLRATGIALEADDILLLRQTLRQEHRDGYRVRSAPLIALGQILSNYVAVGWTGVAHTTDFTQLVSFGPGSEQIGSLIQNTHLFTVMTRALGLKVPA